MADKLQFVDDKEEALRLAMEDYQAHLWTALPCIVNGVNLVEQTLSCQPTIQAKVIDSEGVKSDVTIPLIDDVPIVWPRAGGYALTFPIAVGDEVLVVFSSRCIDFWWESGNIEPQRELRMHDISDGFAILAPTSQPKRLTNVSSSCVQLRNTDGDTYIEICPDKSVKINAVGDITLIGDNINLNASTKIEMNAPNIDINATSDIRIKADSDIEIEAGDNMKLEASNELNIIAETIVTGDGDATLVQEVVAGTGISVDNTDPERPIVTNTQPGP